MKHLTMAAALLAAASIVSGCSQQPFGNSGWVTLFDGTSLDNWTRVGGANWTLADGVVQADSSTSKGSSFLLSKNDYGDFEIRVEFWVSHDANSGIYMRCADRDKIADTSCYEANIFDERPDPSYGTGAITRIATIANMPKAGGRWNTYDITLKGPDLKVVLNGAETAHAQHDKLKSGPIALQWAAGVVKFRKVEIRPL
jgi:hypothetical protein